MRLNKRFYCVTGIALLFSFHLHAQYTRHVILITIDGLRPEFYLDSAWEAKNLRELMRNGSCAREVTSVFPSLTYPNHTSIITGAYPSKHGIYSNSPFIATSPEDSVYWQFDSIKSGTLWEAAKNAGLSTASVLWPVSAAAPVDYNIPDVGRLGEKTYAFSKPKGLIESIKRNVYNEDGPDMRYLFYSPLNDGIDANIAQTAAYIIRKEKPGFMTVHLLGLDHCQHLNGRDGSGVKEGVRQVDNAIGLIVEALSSSKIKDETTVIVMGDHGFVTSGTDVYPNVWLKEAGLINGPGPDDWKAFFFPTAGSSFLHLKDKNDRATLDKVQQILSGRPAGEKKYFRVISGESLLEAASDPRARLVLTGENGAVFGWDMTGKAVRPKEKIKGDHGHFPDSKEIKTGFIVQGAGIKSGVTIDNMSVTDVAPLIAALLRLGKPMEPAHNELVLSGLLLEAK